jgi:hypothetical protein
MRRRQAGGIAPTLQRTSQYADHEYVSAMSRADTQDRAIDLQIISRNISENH